MTKPILDPIKLLLRRQGKKSLRSFSEEIGVSPTFLSYVYAGKRPPGPKILAFLNLSKRVRRTVVYERNGQ